jgi:hypothetical protein
MRPPGPLAWSWVMWPEPGMIASWPCGARATSFCASASGVFRSWSPASISTGTGGKSRLKGANSRLFGGWGLLKYHVPAAGEVVAYDRRVERGARRRSSRPTA